MRMNGMPHHYTCAHCRVDVLTLALQEEKRRQEQLELARARAYQEEQQERRRAAELADGDGDGLGQAALRVFCGTWNLNGRPCNDQDISSWLALHKTARQLSGKLRGSRGGTRRSMSWSRRGWNT